MSCHSIGHAMNKVIEHTLSIYDSGNININIAKSVISECLDAMGFCDGNTDEALICFEEQHRCSCCLKKVKELELYNSNNVPKVAEMLMKNKWLNPEKTVGLTICKKCVTELFEKELNKK